MALGWVFGPTDREPPPLVKHPGPRPLLEEAILKAVQRAPCGVCFSGGRDSSTVLAVATHVARREGLPDPIPITGVFPGSSRTEETEWQELVISHLGLDNWERLTFGDELDLIGPLATPLLQAHGVIWSAMAHVDQPFLRLVPGGSLLDGEGGDEILGSEVHRVHPIARVRRRRKLNRADLKSVLFAAAPARIRLTKVSPLIARQAPTWLRGAAANAHLDAYVEFERARPMPYSASVRAFANMRSGVLLDRNRRILARHQDVALHSPIMDAKFVGSLASQGGFFGPGKRRDVLRTLVPDLLPDEVLARSTKAEFDQAFLGERSRAFVETWTGAGVDESVIDAEALRAEWLSEQPSGLSFLLLQSAWLAAQPPIPEPQADTANMPSDA